MDVERIFALRGDSDLAAEPRFREMAELNDAMLAAYRSGDWEAAGNLAVRCRDFSRTEKFGLEGFYEMYLGRIEERKAAPPGEDWDGVYSATEK